MPLRARAREENGNSMARPTKYSTGRAEAICGYLRIGATRTASVAAAGVSYDAFRRWIKSNPEFSLSVTQAEAECAVAMTKVIWNAALAGEWRAALAWLERRRPQEWGLHASTRLADAEIEQILADLFRYVDEA